MALKRRRAQHRASPKERGHRADQRARRPDLSVIRELREQLRFFKREYQFLKTKCERLELAIASQKPGAGVAYVERTAAEAPRPKIGDVQVATSQTGFNRMRAAWNNLSEKEQEAAIEAGDWEPGAKAN